MHGPGGMARFGAGKRRDSVKVVMDAIVKPMPAAAKGQYSRSATLATTMGPGVKLNGAKFGG